MAAELVAAFIVSESRPDRELRRGARAILTIERRLAAISAAHRDAVLPDQCTDPFVHETLRGIRRALGTAREPKLNLALEDLDGGASDPDHRARDRATGCHRCRGQA